MEIKEEPIESIIKVEAQEFETIVDERLLVEVPPSYLKAADNDLFQPIVLLERFGVSKIKQEYEPEKSTIKKSTIPPAEPAQKLKPDRKWHHCTECTAKFDLKANLRSHFLKTHFKGKLFECHCGSIFREKPALKAHERYFHNPKPASCRICNQTFKRKDEVSRHWRKHHYTDHGPINQNIHWNYRKRDSNNIRLHHIGRYTCDKCGTEVSCFASMRAHWEKHVRPLLHHCDLCPRAFRHKSAVDYHIRVHHIKEKKYKCKKCDFSAVSARWLNEHMETYHNERQECPICKKPVRVMSRHLKRHRIIPQCEIEKVECPICKMFVARKNLKGHIRTVHENLKKCDQCNEAFSSRELRIHKLRAHYDGELFECHCGNVFKTDRDVIVHQRSAHVIIDINCKVCGWKFHKLPAYNSHWAIKHASAHGTKTWTLKEVQAKNTKN